MNVEIRTEAAKFLFWKYLFRIFGIVSLQCRERREMSISEGTGGKKKDKNKEEEKKMAGQN